MCVCVCVCVCVCGSCNVFQYHLQMQDQLKREHHVAPFNGILDSGFQAVDSGFQVLDPRL